MGNVQYLLNAGEMNCVQSVMPPSCGRVHKAMLRSLRPGLSICLSVPFSDSVPFARWRYTRVAVSNTFDRGQHARLCLHPHVVSGGYRFPARYIV